MHLEVAMRRGTRFALACVAAMAAVSGRAGRGHETPRRLSYIRPYKTHAANATAWPISNPMYNAA